jgi:hypothetical protein
MATMLIMGSAAAVVLIALPFLFRAQIVAYNMERERQPPFDCVQGIQEYACPGVEPLRPMQRNASPSDAGRSRARQDQNRRIAVRVLTVRQLARLFMQRLWVQHLCMQRLRW